MTEILTTYELSKLGFIMAITMFDYLRIGDISAAYTCECKCIEYANRLISLLETQQGINATWRN